MITSLSIRLKIDYLKKATILNYVHKTFEDKKDKEGPAI